MVAMEMVGVADRVTYSVMAVADHVTCQVMAADHQARMGHLPPL